MFPIETEKVQIVTSKIANSEIIGIYNYKIHAYVCIFVCNIWLKEQTSDNNINCKTVIASESTVAYNQLMKKERKTNKQ